MKSILFVLLATIGLACGPTNYTLSTSSEPAQGGRVSPTSGIYEEGLGVTIYDRLQLHQVTHPGHEQRYNEPAVNFTLVETKLRWALPTFSLDNDKPPSHYRHASLLS